MTQKSTVLKAYVAVIATLFFWSTSLIIIRYEVGAFSPGALTLMRHIIASLTMLFFYAMLPNKTRLTLQEVLCMMLLGVIGLATYNVFINLGETRVSAALTGFMIGQLPIAITLTSVIVFKSHIRIYGILGFGISFLGSAIMLLIRNDGYNALNMGIIYLLIAILLGGVFLVLQKPLLKTFHAIEVVTFATWGGTLAMFIYAPELSQQIQTVSWFDMGLVMYLGIFPSAIAYSAWGFAITTLPVAQVGLFLYAMPLLTLVLSTIVMGEGLSLWEIVGGNIALLGAYITAKNTISADTHLALKRR